MHGFSCFVTKRGKGILYLIAMRLVVRNVPSLPPLVSRQCPQLLLNSDHRSGNTDQKIGQGWIEGRQGRQGHLYRKYNALFITLIITLFTMQEDRFYFDR